MTTRRQLAAVRIPTGAPERAVAPMARTSHTVAVVTEDASLVDTLRQATPGLSVMSTATPVTLADLLMQPGTAAIVLDATLLGTVAPAIIDRLAEQFPEMPLIAVGTRDDEALLSTQISSGRVYRFLHRPLSVERTRTFVEGAVRRHAGVQPGAAPSCPANPGRPSGPPQRLPPAMVGLTLAVAALLLVSWIAWLSHQSAVSQSPRQAATGSGLIERPAAVSSEPRAPHVARPPRAPRVTAPEPEPEPEPAPAAAAAAAPASPPLPVARAALMNAAALTDEPIAPVEPVLVPLATRIEFAPAPVPMPERLEGAAPGYPLEARRRGLEGWVQVRYTIDAAGHVVDPVVLSADPAGAFDATALAAVTRWRYAPPLAPLQTVQRLVFRLR